ncbi:MAG: alkaline phosphatase D family protein [Maricaulaceae bacterium]
MRLLTSALVLWGLAACAPEAQETADTRAATPPTPAASAEPPSSPPAARPANAAEALAPYYAQLDIESPRPATLQTLPPQDAVLSRIAFGSCNNEDEPIPALSAAAARDPDVFIYAGDNVYGDARRVDPDLPELRESYATLAAHPDFQALAAQTPILAMWDDHDFGLNDAGRRFAFKGYAETLFLDFWGASAEDPRRDRPGVYDAHVFGPEDQRVQIILLDTRYFRDDLKVTEIEDPQRRGRYVPHDPADGKTLLGEAQWAWLEEQLRQPAQVRLIVSSIQILAESHGFERWGNMPNERQRLFDLITETGAEGVVLLSGDRHIAAAYKSEDAIGYPVWELTSSALNRTNRNGEPEYDAAQVQTTFATNNFGEVGVDWEAETVTLRLFDAEGAEGQAHVLAFSDLRTN